MTRDEILARVDPSIRAAVDAGDRAWPRPPHLMSPAEFSALYRTPPAPPRPAGLETTDIAIPTPAGNLPARIYRPAGLPSITAGVVYFHGGSFTTGNLDSHDAICCRLAVRAACRVIAVDYRLMPAHRFPAQFDDAVAATRWAATNAATLDIDPARLCAAGDSSGANIALAAALEVRGAVALRALWLAYPIIGNDFGTASYVANADAPSLTRVRCERILREYLGADPSTADRRAVPLVEPDLRGTPPTVVVNAEFDPLCSDGEILGERLAALGIARHVFLARGMVHGFIKFAGVSEAAARPIDASIDAFRTLL